ncbi:MFS general substrate transporter [Stipitochalara longipes BDJ]|nr:MFS general substrate transporter [Stipitochalara longipes BDJ]
MVDPTHNSNEDAFNKDLEAGVLTGKDDIEAYPVVDETQDEAQRPKEGAVTRTSTKSSWKDPGPPPDGGREAWIQAAMGHLAVMNTWGFVNSFGVFQTYYVTSLHESPSNISWIGTMQIFLLFFIGTFTGRLTDAGYFRIVFLTGSILSVLGLFMASLSTTYWQLFLAQGLCCGLGNGCIFCPALSLLSTYFSKKRGLAIGLAATGSATGGMVFSAMVQQLLPKVGFAWTMRSLAFIDLACMVVCNLLMKTRIPPRKAGAMVDWKSFKEMTYTLFAAGMFFVFWGAYFAYFYLGSFARSIIHLPYTESINLLIVLNSMGVIGRIGPGLVADIIGPHNALIPIVAINGLCLFCWIAVSSKGGLYAWACIYGIVGAAIQSLFPTALSNLTTDLSMAGTRMGMVFTILSFATLTGTPIAGQLIEKKGGGYEYGQIFAGTVMSFGCCLLIAARYTRTKKLMTKV